MIGGISSYGGGFFDARPAGRPSHAKFQRALDDAAGEITPVMPVQPVDPVTRDTPSAGRFVPPRGGVVVTWEQLMALRSGVPHRIPGTGLLVSVNG